MYPRSQELRQSNLYLYIDVLSNLSKKTSEKQIQNLVVSQTVRWLCKETIQQGKG